MAFDRGRELKPISPRPRNNLGRVLLRRSQQCEAEAREAEAKGKTDPAEAAKAKQLKDEAKTKLDAAIDQFEEAVELDPSLLEARLNLGEVYHVAERPRQGRVPVPGNPELRFGKRQGPGDDQQLQPGLFWAWRESPSPARIPTRPSGSCSRRWN